METDKPTEDHTVTQKMEVQANLESAAREAIVAYLSTFSDDSDMVESNVEVIMGFIDGTTYRVEA